MSFRTLPKCPHRRRALYRCPASVALDSHRRCVAAMVAAKLWAPRVRVVAQGIDTLWLFTVRPVTVAWAERLQAARVEAETIDEPELEVGGLTLTMRGHGAGGARYLLESDLWAFKVSPSPKPGRPTVQLEVRALALWANGWRRAAEMALDAMADLCGVGAAGIDALDAQVTRADLCVDFQGWEPRFDDLEIFTTRATRRGAHAGASWDWLQGEDGRASVARKRRHVLELTARLQASRSAVEQHQLMQELGDVAGDDGWAASTWQHGRSLTGFSFGRGAVGGRLYDKRREIGVSGKHWMRTVWRGWALSRDAHGSMHQAFDAHGGVSPYLEDAEVWRLEFQLRREATGALRELIPPEPGSEWQSESLGSWGHFVERLDSVWRHLTTSWLRHGRRQEDDRQATSQVWSQLQHAWSHGDRDVVALHRPAVEAARVVVLPQLAGLLATAAAQVEVLADAGELARTPSDQRPLAPRPYWRTLLGAVRAAHRYAEEKASSLEHRSHERAEALRKRGGSLKGNRLACQARAGAAARLSTGKVKARWWEGPMWKSQAPHFIPGVGLIGSTVRMTSENTSSTPWQSAPTSEVGW